MSGPSALQMELEEDEAAAPRARSPRRLLLFLAVLAMLAAGVALPLILSFGLPKAQTVEQCASTAQLLSLAQQLSAVVDNSWLAQVVGAALDRLDTNADGRICEGEYESFTGASTSRESHSPECITVLGEHIVCFGKPIPQSCIIKLPLLFVDIGVLCGRFADPSPPPPSPQSPAQPLLPPSGYLWSGYGCDRQCDLADINYEIEASLQTYSISGATADFMNSNIPGGGTINFEGDALAFTRTFTGVKGDFCESGNGTAGPMGPCLKFVPGKTVSVRLVNNIVNGTRRFNQTKNSQFGYWTMGTKYNQSSETADVQSTPYYTYLGEPVDSPEEMTAENRLYEDVPGWETEDLFDITNLHFHGMQVVPHLFYPQSTSDPEAPWISVTPKQINEYQSCFCYVLTVPKDHPQGQFWYHIHRHGSAAIQGWQGMVGEILVQGVGTSDVSPDTQLRQQGVRRSELFALWEWNVDSNNSLTAAPNIFQETNFVGITGVEFGGDASNLLVNNGHNEVTTLHTNETMHLRVLCAQITTGSLLFFNDEQGEAVTFWVFASDGISYGPGIQNRSTYARRHLFVAPGQREGVLVQFAEPGEYYAMSYLFNGGPGGGLPGSQGLPDNAFPSTAQVIATFNVTDSAEPIPKVDIAGLVFTPGIDPSRDIAPSQVSSQQAAAFGVFGDVRHMPLAQYKINSKLFNITNPDGGTQIADSSAEFVLSSTMPYFHPFHIHVNPFQVKQMSSGFEAPDFETSASVIKRAMLETNLEPMDKWRDTVVIPPWGITKIWTTFNRDGSGVQLSGKTVFHCHFLGVHHASGVQCGER